MKKRSGVTWIFADGKGRGPGHRGEDPRHPDRARSGRRGGGGLDCGRGAMARRATLHASLTAREIGSIGEAGTRRWGNGPRCVEVCCWFK